ncbi:MAG TPA: PBP1A family penicillin-binding protein [Nitriliruptorales bacterium]|nr:PBP1A family penicillin-binding protein [Nitriliruptorales bacterium]
MPGRRAPRLLAAAAALLAGCGQVVVLEPGDPVRFVRQPQTSQVLAADGSVLADLHAGQDRRDVDLEQVPDALVAAVVAVEDRRFFLHRGVDVPAVARAAVRNVEAGAVEQGGSTITQQYVKNTMTGSARTLRRKVEEASLAYQLERRYSKEEILERYLNTIYLGHGAYGVHAAAERYFGRAVEELSVEQSALLAGLIAAPVASDPYVNPDAALRRRSTVLAAMVATGQVGQADADRAAAAPLELAPLPDDPGVLAPYAVEEVRRLIARDPEGRFAALGIAEDERLTALYTGGLRVHTTIHPAMQAQAEAAVATVLSEPADPYAALVALDPRTGAIRALVGGRDLHDDGDPHARFNLATQGRRQPGSAFKPVVLAAALSRGVPLDRTFPGGASVTIRDPDCGPQPWSPSNYDGRAFGPLTLREATVHSVNTVYARLAADVGPPTIAATARDLGIGDDLDPYCAIALGAEEVTPLQLASAYQPFAALGERHATHLIDRIETADGEVVDEHRDSSHRAVDPAVAYLVTQTLQEVVRRGTGVQASIGRPQAGKTGTTDDSADAWFVGYTPDLLAAVWVGFPEGRIAMQPPRTRVRVEGGRWPAEIWRTFAERALQGVPPSDFPVPEVSLVTVQVDVSRNCLPNPYTPPELVQPREYLRGTEPTELCREPTGPPAGAVPNVVGLTRDIAVRLLGSRGFAVDERPIASPLYPPGYVTGQLPAPGASVDPDRGAVVVWVSVQRRGKAVVPDVVGFDVDRAVGLLEADGWVVQRSDGCAPEGCPPGVGRGRVWSQEPAEGARVEAHSVVQLRVVPTG